MFRNRTPAWHVSPGGRPLCGQNPMGSRQAVSVDAIPVGEPRCQECQARYAALQSEEMRAAARRAS
jgi:hypothetical protein